MQYARMGSSGYQFPPLVVVQGILGHRAIARKLISVADLQKLMEALCDQLQFGGDYPSDSATRRWASKHPGLPEEALESHLLSTDMLQPWARLMVIDHNAQMGQELVSSDPVESRLQAAIIGGIKLGAIGLAVKLILNMWFTPNEITERTFERRVGSRIGRVSRGR